MAEVVAPSRAGGRARKTVDYAKFADESSEEDEFSDEDDDDDESDFE